jgi:hypothetical protein
MDSTRTCTADARRLANPLAHVFTGQAARAFVGGYFVEGHVPQEGISRLFAEHRP